MKKLLFILLPLFFINLNASSQQISKSVIGASGNKLDSQGLSISYTVGEIVVGTMTSDSIQLGNGYYPSLNISTLKVEDKSLAESLILYPNPTSQQLNITNQKPSFIQIAMIDINGKVLNIYETSDNINIDVSNLPTGNYMLSIKDPLTGFINTYKFIKN